MTFKALSLTGLGVLGVGAVSVGGYAISASGSGKSQSAEENTKPTIDPNISKRLLDIGYTFNPPQFTSYEKLNQGCYENLIKASRSSHTTVDEEGEDYEDGEGFRHTKLYGCGVAKMELWDSGDQFGNEKVHYLTFGSEIFLREGNGAWRINTLIDNHSSDELIYRHLLSYFQHQPSGNSWNTDEAFLIVGKVKDANQKGLQEEQKQIAISIGTEELNIKLPGTDGSWFKKNNFLIRGTVPQGSELTKTNHETKEWSGIWIEESKGSPHGMFQDIEVFIGNKENEQVFCKEKNKCGAGIVEKYQVAYWELGKSAPTNWNNAYDLLKGNSQRIQAGTFTNHQGTTTAILNFIKGSKGKWSDSKEICSAKNKEINSDELKKLKVFCSKPSR